MTKTNFREYIKGLPWGRRVRKKGAGEDEKKERRAQKKLALTLSLARYRFNAGSLREQGGLREASAFEARTRT